MTTMLYEPEITYIVQFTYIDTFLSGAAVMHLLENKSVVEVTMLLCSQVLSSNVFSVNLHVNGLLT